MIARFMNFLSVKRQAYSVKKLDLPSKVFLGLALITATYFLHASIPAYPQTAHAAPGINQQLNFQGRLLNSDGTLIENDTYSVVFSLYTTDEGGGAIWSETQSVTTTQGLFRVSLGSVNSLASVNFNQDALYLGIKVGADPEMSPRMRLHSTPYAFEAKRVNGLTVTNNGNNTLNIANGKTATFNNSIAFSGTDGTTFTLPGSSTTLVGTDTSQTLSNKTLDGLTLSGFNYNGGILYTNGSGVVAQTAVGSAGQCLQSNGGGSPVWDACGDTIDPDSLDFSDFSDTMTLDASTSINLGAFNLSSTGTGGLNFGHSGGTSFTANITIGSSGNTVSISPTGIVLAGTARPSKEIIITPEYTQATLTSNGATNTNGTLVGDNTGAADDFRNYYEWTSSEASLQQYTIAARVKLPLDFDEWDTNAFSLEYQTGTASTAENAVSATITPATEADTNHACDLSTDRASTTWTTTNMTCSGSTLSSGSYTWDDAGETAIIRVTVKASSAASAFARAGDITLRYKAAF